MRFGTRKWANFQFCILRKRLFKVGVNIYVLFQCSYNDQIDFFHILCNGKLLNILLLLAVDGNAHSEAEVLPPPPHTADENTTTPPPTARLLTQDTQTYYYN